MFKWYYKYINIFIILYNENYIKITYYITLMNNEELIKEINMLREELEKTKDELIETKEHLKKYTSPSNMKKYYQNHKEEIIKKVKEYKEKNNYKPFIDKEKRKEYNKIAYQKRREKIEQEKMENKNI
jgi:hypothetical protein